MKQEVNYDGREKPGTIIINTQERLLYLVQENGRAIRYGVGVGKPGFSWAGTHHVSQKREWPDWTPPEQMLRRRPDLPHHMAGGPDNPMGARGIYLGASLYRIHGSNEPDSIGQATSSGCIRMTNQDVIDLYNRVSVGATVIVQ
jgi:lipoprotein-anchoring transpeptidase ErfK/SrfK